MEKSANYSPFLKESESFAGIVGTKYGKLDRSVVDRVKLGPRFKN